jgi:hypothetical protein
MIEPQIIEQNREPAFVVLPAADEPKSQGIP